MYRLMHYVRWSIGLSCLLLLMSVPTLAQSGDASSADADTCETIVFDVLDTLDTTCAGTQRNQACYGNIEIETQPVADVTDFRFERMGDLANISDIQSFRLSPLSDDGTRWGVMLMRVQANLPDVLPGQNVTMLFFGDVQVVNNPVFDPENTPDDARPMQAIYFRTGISAATCAETPDSGFVIQTPDGAGNVQLTVNDINLDIGSTVVVRSVDNDALEFNVTEGEVEVEAEGETQTATAGNRVRVPVNSALLPAAPPQEPEPIDPATLENLPLDEIPTNEELNELAEQPTATPESDRPDLPATGECVLATAQDVTVNVRRIPSTDASVVSSLQPDEILTVIGQNSAGDWYETPRGWIAAFVVRTGGDCSALPVTFVASTATPTPPPEPTAYTGPVAGENEYSVIVDYNQFGQQHALRGNLSYPVGDRADNVNIDFINVPRFVMGQGYSYEQYLEIRIRCEGDPTMINNVIASLPSGEIVRCTAEDRVYQDSSWSPGRVGVGWSEEFLAGNQQGYVTWIVTLSVRDGYAPQ